MRCPGQRRENVDLLEAIRTTPTTRRFKAEPPPLEAIWRALDAARFAPSGGNRQPWRVVVVADPQKRKALRDLYQPHWQAYLRRMGADRLLAQAGDDPRLASLRRADQFANALDQIPYHLVVFADPALIAFVDEGLPRRSLVGGASVYPFVQNLLLALRGEGLAGALTTLLAPAEREVRELLGVPSQLLLAAYVLVGYRADPWPRRLSRQPVSQFAYLDSYANPLPEPSAAASS